ncbi:MAG TPA: hypothetical protein PKE45_22635 [Caldilineaceae bacterium]|nr:hypothetical protein [Caldilineaceae bacterium]
MILAIGLAADDTFAYTLAALRTNRIAFHALDVAQLVLFGQIDLRPADPLRSIIALGARRHILEQYTGVLVRLVNIAEGAPNQALSARASGFYLGLSQLFTVAPMRVVNPPLANRSNFSKGLHSALLATLTGWHVPRTLVTNSPEAAADFIASCPDGVVFKGASAVKTWATLYDPKLHHGQLAYLPDCPTLFQERIAGPDIRVHVVDDQLFAELIESTELDYRSCRKNTYQAVALPPEIVSGCLRLRKTLMAPFLGIDFKIDHISGQWYVLEANSMPCYQGYDRRAGGMISRALAEWLTSETLLKQN